MANATRIDERDYGELERRGDRIVLTFSRHLPHPPEKVWRALTEPEHLDAWFPTTIDGDRASGAKLRFHFREAEGMDMEGEMLAFDPPQLMEFRWGDDVLRFELRPDGDGTVLEFTDTFDEIGRAARDAAGWHACLDVLGYEVAGEHAPWSSTERWSHVHGTYKDRLGPEAATMGPPEEWERAHGSS
jgi:uncharacterized protein YndB with AHSA1/START domain